MITDSWGEQKVPYYAIHTDGKICGYCGPFRFLSNFYVIKEAPGVSLGEIYFPTTENAYQAAKYPPDFWWKFTEITPGKAKELGQLAPDFNRKKWDKKKYDLMYDLNWQKFANHPYLRGMLLETDGYHLEERNSWGDTDWGTDEKGEGENNLGKIHMRIRDKLIALRDNNEF